MIKTNDIKKLNEHYGADMSVVMCIEELSELIKALTKCLRYGETASTFEHLVEELADATICLALLQDVFAVKDEILDNEITLKMDRNMRRIS